MSPRLTTRSMLLASRQHSDDATPPPKTPRRSKRSNDELSAAVVTPSPSRRRRRTTTTTPTSPSPSSAFEKGQPKSPQQPKSPPQTKSPQQKKSSPKRKSSPKILHEHHPPSDWYSTYTLIQELRQDRTAPCDWAGAEALAAGDWNNDTTSNQKNETMAPVNNTKAYRFRALLALLLSSQTKDAVVADAIKRLARDDLLSPAALRDLPADRLDGYIRKVGFHNRKTTYIHQTVAILLEKYDGDVPPTADAMMELPGVGPKMAYICESIAWPDKHPPSGIGVDTHMHRLLPLLDWTKPTTKTPEQTRRQLQSWLPTRHWSEINLLLVGFGQEIQQFPEKIVAKAVACSRPVEAIHLLKQCGIRNLYQVAEKEGLLERVKELEEEDRSRKSLSKK